jgi:hypothetical protein
MLPRHIKISSFHFQCDVIRHETDHTQRHPGILREIKGGHASRSCGCAWYASSLSSCVAIQINNSYRGLIPPLGCGTSAFADCGSHGDHTRAIEYEDVNIVLRTEERRREREREREISIYLLHGRLSQCGMSPDIPNKKVPWVRILSVQEYKPPQCIRGGLQILHNSMILTVLAQCT